MMAKNGYYFAVSINRKPKPKPCDDIRTGLKKDMDKGF